MVGGDDRLAGRELRVVYPDGARKVIVGPDVKVTAFDAQARSALTPGLKVGGVTRPGADKVYRAGRLTFTR